MHVATIRIKAGKEGLEVLKGALGPEVGEELPRTHAMMEPDGEELVLRLEAEDVPSLRAAINSYMRWLQMGIETMNEVEG